MSEQSERARLRAEARRYGMTPQRGMSSRELDDEIQAKVTKDFHSGICSACRGPLHAGSCTPPAVGRGGADA